MFCRQEAERPQHHLNGLILRVGLELASWWCWSLLRGGTWRIWWGMLFICVRPLAQWGPLQLVMHFADTWGLSVVVDHPVHCPLLHSLSFADVLVAYGSQTLQVYLELGGQVLCMPYLWCEWTRSSKFSVLPRKPRVLLALLTMFMMWAAHVFKNDDSYS